MLNPDQEFIPANEAIVYRLEADAPNVVDEITDMYHMRCAPLILLCPPTPPLSPADYQANIIATLTSPGSEIYLYREPVAQNRELTSYLIFQQYALTMRLVAGLHSAKVNYPALVLELIPICIEIARNKGCHVFNFHMHKSAKLLPELSFFTALDKPRYSTDPNDIEYEAKI